MSTPCCLATDARYLGPMPLTQAYRYNADTRDGAGEERSRVGRALHQLGEVARVGPVDLVDVVAEGVAPEPEEGPCVVLCLKERELLEETMRIRAVSERQVLACAGVFAASARSAAPSPFPIYDVLDPRQREALCARVLATAGLEASAPLPPSAGGARLVGGRSPPALP